MKFNMGKCNERRVRTSEGSIKVRVNGRKQEDLIELKYLVSTFSAVTRRKKEGKGRMGRFHCLLKIRGLPINAKAGKLEGSVAPSTIRLVSAKERIKVEVLDS